MSSIYHSYPLPVNLPCGAITSTSDYLYLLHDLIPASAPWYKADIYNLQFMLSEFIAPLQPTVQHPGAGKDAVFVFKPEISKSVIDKIERFHAN